MSQPKISVVMSVYNREAYIGEAVESILEQSFRDFELIVLDDGSTDDTLAILQAYQTRDERIRLIACPHRGIVATVNQGISLARGEWVARMDSDDIALPYRFEDQMEWLALTGADVCGGWIRYFGSAEKRMVEYPKTDQAIKMGLLFGSSFANPTVMMKAALIKQLGYDGAWEKAEDYDLWERAVRAGWEMTNIPKVLLLYRRHASQISEHFSGQQYILTQQIRRRYWEYVFDLMGLNKSGIDEISKIDQPSPCKSDMDSVDLTFSELLRRHQGEARELIFNHAVRLYLRAAADCEDIVARWGRLNSNFGTGPALKIKLKLWVLSTLRIRPNGWLNRIRKFSLS